MHCLNKISRLCLKLDLELLLGLLYFSVLHSRTKYECEY